MLRLRELREEHGLTQAQVVEAVGVTIPAYSMLENGKRNPSYELIIKLADYFHISIDTILSYERVDSL
jgi:transcriptional regulator with XRE-family HTH domain